MSNYHVVSCERHAQQRWRSASNHAFARDHAVVAIAAAEAPAAALSLPMAFIDEGDCFMLIAVLGAHGNLFVAPDGQWRNAYLPAVLRSYPFALASTADGQRVLCIDEDSGLLCGGPGGEPLFIDGKPSAALRSVWRRLLHDEQDRLATRAACGVLQKFRLLRPWPLRFNDAGGERQCDTVFQIDEEALKRLPAEALGEMQACGALQLAYCQLLSRPHQAQLHALQAARDGIRIPNPHLARVLPEQRSLPPAAPRVLLVASTWSTMAEMPHLLKRAGSQVDVLCAAGNPAVKNGYYDAWIDGGASLDVLTARLSALRAAAAYDYILLGEDPIMWKIYREQRPDLLPLLPIKNQAAHAILSKVGFAEYCRDNAIASPDFVVVAAPQFAAAALAALGLPIVVKENYASGGQGVRIFRDAPAYCAFMAAYDYAEPLLAQQFIAGELIGVEAMFKNGDLLMFACSQDLGATVGPSSKRRYCPNDGAIGATLARLGKCAVLHGFVSAGAIRIAGGEAHFLFEADPRPNKWLPYGRWFGHDFSLAFEVFMGADGDASGMLPGTGDGTGGTASESGEVEFFPNHAARLLNEGLTTEAILHLLDFQKNLRFTVYDPILLADKIDCLRNGLNFG